MLGLVRWEWVGKDGGEHSWADAAAARRGIRVRERILVVGGRKEEERLVLMPSCI